MVASATLIPIAEYLSTAYQPDRDFVEGQVEERNVGEFEHGRIQGLLAAWFVNHEREWAIVTVTEQRMRVGPNRIRIPDVCLLRASAPREKVTQTAPLLCIEILSPEDRLSRTLQVMEDYLAMGLEHLWIVDPIERTAYTFTAAGLLHAPGPRLTIPDSSIYINLPELFSSLD